MFRHPHVHPQEDLYMQFYGISVMYPYKYSGQCQVVVDKTSFPEDEHLDVRNMSKPL